MWLNEKQAGLIAGELMKGEDDDFDSGEAGHGSLEEREAVGVPNRIDEYHIVRHIDRGGMGEVYEARHGKTKRTVALKIIAPGRYTGTNMRRFRQEVRVLGRLNHPGIASMYEAGTFSSEMGERPYFAMEYVEGIRITKYAEQKNFGVRERCRLVASLCEAVQHAHTRGVIHRDLKPGNILVQEAGEGSSEPQVKILDFGVAGITDSDLQVTTLETDVSQVMGTIPYMSPEQIGGDPEALDVRSDVYALGVLLYELLSGRLPYDFPKRDIVDAVRVLQTTKVVALRSVRPGVPVDLATIVSCAMSEDIEKRYQSASEMAADLHRFLKHEAISAHPPSLPYLISRFVRRHRVLVATLSILILTLSGAVVAINGARRNALESEEQAHETADFLLKWVNELSSVVGTSGVRRSALESITATYAAQLGQTPENSGLQTSYAAALEGMGDLELDSGNEEAAAERMQEALVFRRALADRFPDEPLRQVDLSINLVKVGDVAKQGYHYDDALRWYEEALAIDEQLVERHPEVAHYADNLSWSYDRLSDLEMRGDHEEKFKFYLDKRLQLTTRLHEEDPDNLVRLYGLCDCLRKYGIYLHHEGGPLEEAHRHLTKAREMVSRLIEEEPYSRSYQVLAAQLEQQAMKCAGARGDSAAVLASGKESMRLYLRLIEDEPSSIPNIKLAGLAVRVAGVALMGQGMEGEAERCMRKGIEVFLRVLSRGIQEAALRRQIVVMQLHLRRVQLEIGKTGEAKEGLARAIDLQRAILDIDGENVAERAKLFWVLMLSNEEEDFREAMRFREAALDAEVIEEGAYGDILEQYGESDLRRVWERLGGKVGAAGGMGSLDLLGLLREFGEERG